MYHRLGTKKSIKKSSFYLSRPLKKKMRLPLIKYMVGRQGCGSGLVLPGSDLRKKPDPKFDKENWASFQPYYFLIKLTFYFFYGHKSQYI